MDSAPVTFRPNVRAGEMPDHLKKQGVLAEEGQGAEACGEASAPEIGGKTRWVGLSDDQSAEGRSLSRSKRPPGR
jgi:hypothetical protein